MFNKVLRIINIKSMNEISLYCERSQKILSARLDVLGDETTALPSYYNEHVVIWERRPLLFGISCTLSYTIMIILIACHTRIILARHKSYVS